MMRYDTIGRVCVAALLAAGWGFLSTACGSLGGDECTFSEDCAADEVCYNGGQTNQCVQQCTEDQECPSGTCTEAIDQPENNPNVNGCLPQGASPDAGGGGSNGGNGGCQSNTDCPSGQVCQERTGECRSLGGNDAGPGPQDTGGQDDKDGFELERDGGGNEGCSDNSDCPGDQVCRPSGQCDDPFGGGGGSFKFVRLGEDPNCQGEDEGPDLFGVRLKSANGQTIGWGEVVGQNLTSSENRNASGVLTGSRPNLEPSGDNNQLCPARGFSSSSVVTVGCGGWLIVGFPQGSGYTTLQEGQTITVFEYGRQCCATAGACPPEPVSVRVCNGSPSAIGQGDDSSCTSNLGSVTGEGVVSITAGDLGN